MNIVVYQSTGMLSIHYISNPNPNPTYLRYLCTVYSVGRYCTYCCSAVTTYYFYLPSEITCRYFLPR